MTHEQTRKVFSNLIGYFCMMIFFSLTTYIVYVYYSYIAPAVLEEKQYGKFMFHFIFGNWLAINIYFNYTMACLTSPGLAKDYQHLARQYPTCKKCSLNKPPRTHHCRWCDACILRFDHHCPWLNNCVGFYNHRYFFQFCCFMSMGCFYATIFGYREYQISRLGVQLFRHIDSFFKVPDILENLGVDGFLTYYVFILALPIACALFGMSCCHGHMISRDETLVERFGHLKSEDELTDSRVRMIDNWKRFLGVHTTGEFVRRVLLPSTHRPRGNGISPTTFDDNVNLFSYPREHVSYTSNIYDRLSDNYLVRKYQSELSSWHKPQVLSREWRNIVQTC